MNPEGDRTALVVRLTRSSRSCLFSKHRRSMPHSLQSSMATAEHTGAVAEGLSTTIRHVMEFLPRRRTPVAPVTLRTRVMR